MDKRPNWQTLFFITLYLGSFVLFGFAFYYQHQQNNIALKTVLSELEPVTTATNEQAAPSYTPGLFGIATTEPEPEKEKPEEKIAVNFGPKSLQGVFIQNNRAYALVTDYSNNHQIIAPSSITSHSINSVTIQTSQGIKSLHIQHDRNGVDIRRIRKRRKDNNGVVKEEISEADRIRLMLLQGSK
ncbi:hypothetical protein A3759_03510 [Thalassolituus sp. HI0120]|nr:hypothetical protein A3759_03510 [Thalassolituus sp. HI0120]